MNMHALDLETNAQAAIVETEALAQKGFTPGEVVFLLRLDTDSHDGLLMFKAFIAIKPACFKIGLRF